MDECFAALDVLTIKMLQEIIVNLQNENRITICICDHQARDLLACVDIAMILSNGKIIAEKHNIKVFQPSDLNNTDFINSLKNTNNAISLREIGNEIAFAHAGMRQQPYLHLMLNWGHTNGDFIFLEKK